MQIPKLDPAVIEAYKKLDSTSISDALDRLGIPGGLYGIKPVTPGVVMCGQAFTVRYVPCGEVKGTVGDFLDDVEPGQAVSFGNTPDLTGLPGIHIECKRVEQLRPYSWLEQADRDAVCFGDGLPAVFFRRSRSPWLVVMKLEDWLKIYRTQSEPRKTAPSE